MGLKEMLGEGVDGIHLLQKGPVTGSCERGIESFGCAKEFLYQLIYCEILKDDSAPQNK
jgi:hypothetical protein